MILLKSLSPCTFTYKNSDSEISPQEAVNSNKTELIQLGLIADDIKDSPLFNYVGSTMKYSKVVKEKVVDEITEEVVEPEITEEVTTLGLKPLPLAVLALTACKYLINEVEELKSKL